jgi:hypothetical protein
MIDKSNWPPGEWMNEPDEVRWVDEESGLECIINRNTGLGILCGYVWIKKGHPYYKEEYEELNKLGNIKVHGDLTFSRSGRDLDTWLLGFDCGHDSDIIPLELRNPIEADLSKRFGNEVECDSVSYKNIEFLKNECRSLARQLKSIEKQYNAMIALLEEDATHHDNDA